MKKVKKYTIEDLRQYALSNGGICLSNEYVNCKQKIKWQCKKGHTWDVSWDSINNHQTWCSDCDVDKYRTSIFELQKHAISKGGKLISTEYVNSNMKLQWECDKGHRWPASWSSVKTSGSWCFHCSNNMPNILELQSFAISKGGKLISTEYKDNKQKLEWECGAPKHHRWPATWNNVKNKNSWCPYCEGNVKINISELQKYAIDKGGKLISTTYISNRKLLEWECKKGHRWIATWNNIHNGNTWCLECSTFKTEKLCKEILEDKLGITFKKTRFYINKLNYRKFYEFDGYNEENKIAFEYHGYQHYEYPNHWHKTLEDHEEAKERDRLKEQYCKDNNITLIIIPYKEENNLEEYINNQLNLFEIKQ